MNQLEATRVLLRHAKDAPIVASLGNPKYDLALAGDRPQNFYLWGGMGLAGSVGLGLALAQPGRRVIGLEGDGSLLMNLGSLATIAWRAPRNYLLVVWDNARYELTGQQRTATSAGADLAGVALAAGIPRAHRVKALAEFEEALARELAQDGPAVIVAAVDAARSPGRPPKDPVFIKDRFMAALGTAAPGVLDPTVPDAPKGGAR
ncbi:MAG TPA: thiamine pyrophosphate-dependent enzyme [Candidatus Sulfotelmatobacter sp.]|nr:thiamine pyrophosphate-dependent enzyme [Candidatus Sulfotelmatobacter sp.]